MPEVADELKPAYLLSGSDRPKIERALHRLRDRIGESAVEGLSGAEASAEDVVAACNARGLFASGGRLVLVEHVEKWKAADVKVLAAYLSSPAPETVLALVADGIKKDSALAKACSKSGELLFFDVPRSKLPGWVGEQFKRLGASADTEACRALVELVGENLPQLETEISKLAVWARGEHIGREAVELLAADPIETSAFGLTDSWGRRDTSSVLAACETALEHGRSGRRDEIAKLLGFLTAHVLRVRECQQLAAEGRSAREAATILKRNPYYVQKLFGQAANFSPRELDGVVVRLARLDSDVKGGSRLPADLELERALVDASRPADTRRTETVSSAASG